MLTPGAFEDRRSLQIRLAALKIGAIVLFGLLAVGFWIFQVVQHTRFREMAENNHRREIPLRAPRGVLYDRDGRVLVENENSFTIALVREQSKNVNASITLLAEATGVDEAVITEAIQRRRRDPLYRPIPVIEQATLGQVTAVMARQQELPEIVIQQVPTRKYKNIPAHLVGYVSEIREAQLDRPEFAGLQAGAIVGQAGLEQAYNRSLQGEDGNRIVVVDIKGREIDQLQAEDPVEGQRLQLTIDADLQKALEDGFAHEGYVGAAAFLDPRNGEVLAMTSLPAFDPNDFAVGIDRVKWAGLNADPQQPLRNRLLQGMYPPGSTFKVVMAIAALEEGIITPDFKVNCSGSKYLYGRSWACSAKGGHGTVDLRHAIEKSCNVFFYTVGDMMKIDVIHKWAARLGLVGRTGIDLPNEKEALVPSTEWKKRVRGEPWYAGETISVAIGQGAVTVTPIALATMMATVANGGTLVTPHVVKARDTGKGWEPVVAPSPRSTTALSPELLKAVRDGLWMAVNEAGTATRGRLVGRDIVGKTGTAQVISLQGGKAAAGRTKMNLNDHGWFVFFAPRDNPQIAGVVFTEHSKHGYLAAPIAKHVIETFFNKQEGKPLPVLAPKPVVIATGATGVPVPNTPPPPSAPRAAGGGAPRRD